MLSIIWSNARVRDSCQDCSHRMGDRYNEIYTFIMYSFILGFGFGLLYDFFRIIRMTVTVPEILYSRDKGVKSRRRITVDLTVFVCDILFFVSAACITAIFIFHVNNGNIRGIALFGSLIGFILYYNTVGRLITLISHLLIRCCYYLIVFVIRRVIGPMIGFGYACIKKLFVFVSETADALYTYRCIRRIISSAKRGFR